MLRSLRQWVLAPVRACREHRWLALLFGVGAGFGALAVAWVYAHLSVYEWLLLPLGVGGTTYYFAHYEVANWNEDASLRAFCRNFAMIVLAFAFVPEDVPFAEGAASYLAAYSVVMFVMVSTAVSVNRAAARDDGEANGTSDDTADQGVIGAADAD